MSDLIKRLMQQPLPSKTYQRKLQYRPSLDEIDYYYELINQNCFDGQLKSPVIFVGRIHKVWGVCHWENDLQQTGSYCWMRLSDKWFCQQWLINILAHEMVHQFVWDIYRWEHRQLHGRDIYTGGNGHGPSFFAWRERLAMNGLYLKTVHDAHKWFKYQDLSKC